MMEALALRWSLIKVAIGHDLSVSPDALHVLAGALLFVGLDAFLRRSAPRLPWLILLAIEAANEYLDLTRPPGGPENDIFASLHDVALTMALPTVLALLWRRGERPVFSQPDTRFEPFSAVEQGTLP